jgi:hypothetical protein
VSIVTQLQSATINNEGKTQDISLSIPQTLGDKRGSGEDDVIILEPGYRVGA